MDNFKNKSGENNLRLKNIKRSSNYFGTKRIIFNITSNWLSLI